MLVVMHYSVTRLFYIFSALLLLYLLSTSVVRADDSWVTQSSRYLEQLLKNNPDRLPALDQAVVRDFYQQRQYRPVWSDQKGRLDRAFDLLHVIIHAKDEGLEPNDYYLDDIRKYWDSTGLGESVQLDLFLSAALYRYSQHVYSGRFDPADVDKDWHIKNQPLVMPRLFADVASKISIAKILKDLPPGHTGYQLLKQQLRHFRQLARQGGWQKLEWGPVLENGVQHKQVVQLRQLLKLTGDLSVDPFPDMDIYDRWLEEAVMHYQERHGLEVDGKVGPQTRRSLNVTVGDRIRQIRINMERWRWMPRDLGKRYLLVNMTGFELNIMEDGAVVLAMPVIIGNAYRSTPSFSGLVSYMEYNPYWTIPLKLVFEDIIPKQIADPTYLARRGIKLYRGWANPREIDPKTVDWRTLEQESFPYWLRQEPGAENALGRIKFIFSNPYNIYLHGTPDTHLFDRVVRAFSAGCIRVKDPVKLAAFLLNDGSQQKEEEVLENIHLGTNQGVTLPVAVPIYLVYWTTWVDQQGRIHFRKDIYGRDNRLYELFGS
jgi:murein L,D-transpeptidase YcbB/YkuD